MTDTGPNFHAGSHTTEDGRTINLTIRLNDLGLPIDDLNLPENVQTELSHRWETFWRTKFTVELRKELNEKFPLPKKPIPGIIKAVATPSRDWKIWSWKIWNEWTLLDPLLLGLGILALVVGGVGSLIMIVGLGISTWNLDGLQRIPQIFSWTIFILTFFSPFWIDLRDSIWLDEPDTKGVKSICGALGLCLLLSTIGNILTAPSPMWQGEPSDASNYLALFLQSMALLGLTHTPWRLWHTFRMKVSKKYREAVKHHEANLAETLRKREEWKKSHQLSAGLIKEFIEAQVGAGEIWTNAASGWSERVSAITKALAEGNAHKIAAQSDGEDTSIIASFQWVIEKLEAERAEIRIAEDSLAQAKEALKLVAQRIETNLGRSSRQNARLTWLEQQESNHETARFALDRSNLELEAALNWFNHLFRNQQAEAYAQLEVDALDRPKITSPPGHEQARADLEVARTTVGSKTPKTHA